MPRPVVGTDGHDVKTAGLPRRDPVAAHVAARSSRNAAGLCAVTDSMAASMLFLIFTSTKAVVVALAHDEIDLAHWAPEAAHQQTIALEAEEDHRHRFGEAPGPLGLLARASRIGLERQDTVVDLLFRKAVPPGNVGGSPRGGLVLSASVMAAARSSALGAWTSASGGPSSSVISPLMAARSAN